jgi:hypothetical protein
MACSQRLSYAILYAFQNPLNALRNLALTVLILAALIAAIIKANRAPQAERSQLILERLARVLFFVWVVLLTSWVVIAALSGMAFDPGVRGRLGSS